MLQAILRKLFGSANDRLLKKYQKSVEMINALEPDMEKLSDDDLKARTSLFKNRLKEGESLDKLLPEAFAVVREASKRVLGMRPFDVQLVGGMILHNGMITEMKTGEGKTLVATLPVYLNALAEKGVHVITVNDYLAKRDAEWMGQIYRFLGLSVGCIVHGMTDQERRAAYGSDITYGTNHEFGFDYLRDNMKFRLTEMVQRGFNFAIVDEVDSILIDEARTPLIISGPTEDSSELYAKIDKLIKHLTTEEYEIDEKSKSVTLTEAGVEKLELLLRQQDLIEGNGLYDVQNLSIVHHINQALKAHKNFNRDIDYLVKDNKIIIVDEFTGRMMEGRRYSEGLHQALEAKEGVEIQMENQTLASITYQNFFRQYKKLSGMTGTAMTEADEFEEIYNLRVVVVPTNVTVLRQDHDDEVYLTADEKYMAMAELIRDCRSRNQPVLVGTTSIEKSEYMSALLKQLGIHHNVLNARYHEQEAYIIADAGRLGAVTIATNMAGRGTDIKLGGNFEMRAEKELSSLEPGTAEYEAKARTIRDEIEVDKKKVLEAGGLYVIGTERHESRRIDNQLRGRSGRQGDPGASKFYISLQDDLMRIFGSERLDTMLRNLGVQKGEAIVHKWITKSIERAQQKVEARNFDIRKHLLRYDDVMNEQRKIIYSLRREVMDAEEIQDTVAEMRRDLVERIVRRHIPVNSLIELWGLNDLHAEILRLFALDLPIQEWANEEGIAEKELEDRIYNELIHKMSAKEQMYGSEMLRTAEKTLFLRVLDSTWKDHLQTLDHLRQGINLRAYAQSNPLNEYKREAFNLFESMLDRLREEIVSKMAHFEISADDISILERMLDFSAEGFEEQEPGWMEEEDQGSHEPFNPEQEMQQGKPIKRRGLQADEIDPEDPETWGRIQRNALCPCGSGNKYKHCHGKV